MTSNSGSSMDEMKALYPEKFASLEQIFGHIRPGARIFISGGCSEPQYLIQQLLEYVDTHGKAFFDAEMLQIWKMGKTPYTDPKFKDYFRHNAFFISGRTREAVNKGQADYTPMFLSEVPKLFFRGLIPLDIALIQTSLPDKHGYMNLGVSVDIVKAALQTASMVIAQANQNMPRIHGDGFVHIRDVNFVVPYDEPLQEYDASTDDEVAARIGQNVGTLIRDGDTLQIGYGRIPSTIPYYLFDKKDLGIHTEVLSDGLIELIKQGVVNNSRKNINRGKSLASLYMGCNRSYEYIEDNPTVVFRGVDYTNNPMIISQHENMVSINSALEIDLTGQTTAESIGNMLYSGIGGQADFVKGAILSRGGRVILVIPSTAQKGEVSRIVPSLKEGASVTIMRGEIQYVVTEYGIAYLYGKTLRERAMSMISIAHPKFRSWLIEEAKKINLIYPDQKFIEGVSGKYPAEQEMMRITGSGLNLFLRPVRINDEPLLKEFYYSLSPQSMRSRFYSPRKDMPHERLQQFVIVDYTQEVSILATIKKDEREIVLGVGSYFMDENTHTAETAFVTRDEYQNKGVCTELLAHLILLARKQGLLSLEAIVLIENKAMVHIFKKAGFEISMTARGIHRMNLDLQ